MSFDPNNTLLSGKLEMTPKSAIELGIDLCAAVEAVYLNVSGHGCIWPGNVTFEDGDVYIGPSNHLSVKELDPRALEYVAPEQFWNGECSPASDVYSIGLILYTALNGGKMPFFEKPNPETGERATALRNRMRGIMMPYPRTAGRELGEVIIKATAFNSAERYEDPKSLRQALQSLSEGAFVPAAVPVIRLTKEEAENVRSYKVDKEFEPVDPEETAKAVRPKKEKKEPPMPVKVEKYENDEDAVEFRKHKRSFIWILPVVTLITMIIAIVLLLHSCSVSKDDEPVYTLPLPTNGPVDASGLPIHTAAPAPAETPEPTPEPTPDPTPEPTPVEHSYEVVVADLTWSDAKAACEAKGGHLVTVDSQEEFDTVIGYLAQTGVHYAWIGAQRSPDDIWHNVTGEPMSFSIWDTGEPSYQDLDGTLENCVILWNRNGRWLYNDTRNDPISILPAYYRGNIAYICEYGN